MAPIEGTNPATPATPAAAPDKLVELSRWLSLPQSVVDDLRARYGDTLEVLTHPVDPVSVVAKRPSQPDWRRFQQAITDEARKPQALENLGRVAVVYPDQAGYDALLVGHPGYAETFGNAVAKMAGLTSEAERKKL